MGRIQVAFSTDERFVAQTGVALHTLLKRASRPVAVTVLSSGLAEADRHRLEAVARRFGAMIRVIAVDPNLAADLPILHRRMSPAVYFRLWLADFLPGNMDRILYLDSDIICRGDIAPLFDADLGGATLGAVRQFRTSRWGSVLLRPSYRASLMRADLFNSGVLLIDLKRWRARGIADAVLAWRRASGQLTRLHDQDALNAILRDDWHQLSARWNFGNWFYRHTGYCFARNRARLAPMIVHYSHYLRSDPYRAEYAAALAECVRDYGFALKDVPPLTLLSRAKRLIRQLHVFCMPFGYAPARPYGEGRTIARTVGDPC